MPFGLTGAPQLISTSYGQDFAWVTMQGMQYIAYQYMQYIAIYCRFHLDDILIHSNNIQVHAQHLKVVFQRLLNAELTLRGTKCHIGLPSMHYLGHIFSDKGMSPDPSKVQDITDWPIPTNPAEIRQFLGLTSYYSHYIFNFSNIAGPLYALTQKNVPFTWDIGCSEAFDTLKSHLVQSPVLAYPHFHQESEPFVLQMDASAIGLGAALEQYGHVIAYASRSRTSSERNYSVIQQECLAIVFAFKQFRHYLLGRSFQIHTDYEPYNGYQHRRWRVCCVAGL